MKKTLISLILALAMTCSLAACGDSAPAQDDAEKPADSADTAYTVGICQIETHPALDAATKGFQDAIEEALPGQVTFHTENASGDVPTCGVICTGFAADEVDLILANATPSLQAAAAATDTIPILGTAVTEYGVALELEDLDGTVGGNLSGTAD